MVKKKNETTMDQEQDELNIGDDQEQATTSQTNEQPQQKTIRAIFLTNCTHNRDRYEAGQKEDLSEELFEVLYEAKAVRRLEE